MEKEIKCLKFEECSAAICPLQPDSMAHGVWYSDEDICIARKYQKVPWVKKQKLIVKAGVSSDKYFTVEMLEAARQIRKGMEGIDPDQPLNQADDAEKKWVAEKMGRVIAKKNKKLHRVIAKKKPKSLKKGKKKRGRPKKEKEL